MWRNRKLYGSVRLCAFGTSPGMAWHIHRGAAYSTVRAFSISAPRRSHLVRSSHDPISSSSAVWIVSSESTSASQQRLPYCSTYFSVRRSLGLTLIDTRRRARIRDAAPHHARTCQARGNIKKSSGAKVRVVRISFRGDAQQTSLPGYCRPRDYRFR